MYAWIWRHLPFRRWYLKLGLALALVAGVAALFWYVAFPWAEPLLPFDDVQVSEDGGAPADQPADQVGPDQPTGPEDSAAPGDHDLPYATEEAPASPTSTSLPR